MATVRRPVSRAINYPTSDGRPRAETDRHKLIMVDALQTIGDRFAADPMVYVSGDLMLFYEEGNRRKHIAPDIFLVRGVPKLPERDYYLPWVEGRSPNVVIELTSKTTRREDQTKKRDLYRDVLKVREYFQFDPFEDYLDPSLQGDRLVRGRYVAVRPVLGRLPSEELGLHLERDGTELRFFDPATGQRLQTLSERLAAAAAEDREAIQRNRAELAESRVELAETQAELAESEMKRLRFEIEALRRRPDDGA